MVAPAAAAKKNGSTTHRLLFIGASWTEWFAWWRDSNQGCPAPFELNEAPKATLRRKYALRRRHKPLEGDSLGGSFRSFRRLIGRVAVNSGERRESFHRAVPGPSRRGCRKLAGHVKAEIRVRGNNLGLVLGNRAGAGAHAARSPCPVA